MSPASLNPSQEKAIFHLTQLLIEYRDNIESTITQITSYGGPLPESVRDGLRYRIVKRFEDFNVENPVNGPELGQSFIKEINNYIPANNMAAVMDQIHQLIATSGVTKEDIITNLSGKNQSLVES